MKQTREIEFYERHFLDFYESLENDVQRKIEWTLGLISVLPVVPVKYFKIVTGADGLYEIRVEWAGNIFRVFAFNGKGRIVVLGNGFQKKSQLLPKSEIKRALKLKKKYEEERKL